MDEGWIKIHRKMLEWEWFNDSTTLKLFINMLFKANYKPYKRMGKTYPAGSLICLREALEECGLTPMQVRRSLEKLKSTGEITTKTLGHATLFTITNWSKYQTTDCPNQNYTQDGDYQYDTFNAPYDDDHTNAQTNDQTEKQSCPNQNYTQFTQYQHDTRQDNRDNAHTHAHTDAQRDAHSDAQTNNKEYKEGKEDVINSAYARDGYRQNNQTRNDTDIPQAPYNPSQGYGAPPIIPYPQTAKEVMDTAALRGIAMTEAEANDFINYYGGLGWTLGKSPIRNWTMFIPKWHENSKNRSVNNGTTRNGFDRKHVASADEFGEGDQY